MKKHSLNFILVSLACLTVASLAGSSLGTLAWYAYNTRATVSYQGTAVQKAEQLQIGLYWGAANKAGDPKMVQYGAEELEVIGDSSYYFMPIGSGFSATAMSYYLSQNGHATSELVPVTSGAYGNEGDPAQFGLWRAPLDTYEQFNRFSANRTYYVKIPFVFRVMTNDGTPVAGSKIWLTDVVAEATSQNNNNGVDVAEAIRLYNEPLQSESPAVTLNKFLLNPTATDNGFDYVAGVLNLGGTDGYYDYDVHNNIEYVYGEKDETAFAAAKAAVLAGEGYAFDTWGDPNGTGADTTKPEAEQVGTTFYAKHKKNVKGYANYLANVNETQVDFRKKASYKCFNTVRPKENATTGEWDQGDPLAYTETVIKNTATSETTCIGRCNLTIYLEGWDHCIIDQLLGEDGHGAPFNLGLQFEINRV